MKATLITAVLCLFLIIPAAAQKDVTTKPAAEKAGEPAKQAVEKPVPPGSVDPIWKRTLAAGETFTETFEEGWDHRWFFTEKISVVADKDGKGHVLNFSGLGHAELIMEFQDFTLDYRLKPGKGVGFVSLRIRGEPPDTTNYGVVFEEKRILIQRHAQRQMRIIAMARTGVTPNKWHKVSIKLVGSQIDVSLDDKKVVSAKDSKPLPPGMIAFFVHQGAADWAIDDVKITGQGEAAAK